MNEQPLNQAVEARPPSCFPWSVRAAVLLAGALTWGCASAPPGPPAPPPEVEVVPAVTQDVQDTEEFTGRVEALLSVDLRSRVTGYLLSAPFNQGADVEEGTLLFKIDPSTYDAALAQAEAAVKLAEAHRQSSVDTLARDRASPGATPQAVLVQDLGNLAEADASVGSAKAARDAAKLNVTFTDVKAPFSGRISRRIVDKGNLVQADSTTLGTLVSLDPLYAYFDIDERTLLRLRRLVEGGKISRTTRGDVNLPVFLGLADETGFTYTADDAKDLPSVKKGDYRHPGMVKFSDNKEDPQTGTLRAWGEFPNPGKVLSPGMFARILLPIGAKHPAVVVPEAALVADQGRKLVFVVKDALDDKGEVVKNEKGEPLKEAEARYVEIGSYQQGMRVITTGIKAGEKVVVNGLQRVRDKAKVREKAVEAPKAETANAETAVTNERAGK